MKDLENKRIITAAITGAWPTRKDNPALPDVYKRQAMESAGVEITKIEDSSEFSDAVSEVVEKYKNQDPLIKAFVEMVEAME